MHSFKTKSVLLVILMLSYCVNAFSQNKVVVIPLGDNKVSSTFTEELSFPAPSFLASTIVLGSIGLTYPSDTNAGTKLVIRRPINWDGQSDVQLTLLTLASGPGTAQFFARPENYNDSDVDVGVSSINTGIESFTQSSQYKEFSLTIPAASLLKSWWSISVARVQSNGTTVTLDNDISLISATLRYSASLN